MTYRNQTGRLLVDVSDDGGKMHDYRHGCTIAEVEGKWNEWYPPKGIQMSIEEMRDLRYLLDRAIAAADDASKR
jgi:hypothetical protein